MRTVKELYEGKEGVERRTRTKMITVCLSTRCRRKSIVLEHEHVLERATTDVRGIVDSIIAQAYRKIDQARRQVERRKVARHALEFADVSIMQSSLSHDDQSIFNAWDS